MSSVSEVEHIQLEVLTPAGELIQVDHAIHPLLRILWKLGMKTFYSCQGTPTWSDDVEEHGCYIFGENDGVLDEIMAQVCHLTPRNEDEERIQFSILGAEWCLVAWDISDGYVDPEKTVIAPSSNGSRWCVELCETDPFDRGKTICLRFPAQDLFTFTDMVLSLN